MSRLTLEEWIAKRDEADIRERVIKGAPLKDRGFLRMQATHGEGPDGATCGNCVFFKRSDGRYAAKTYFKCAKYGITGGPGTDWRVSNRACGLYEAAAMELPAPEPRVAG